MNEGDLRQKICDTARRMQARDYIHGRAGNLSARISPGEILTTPAGVEKSSLRAEQLIVVDAKGVPLRAQGDLQPTSELPMHLEVYRQRPDVGAVLHAHPAYCIALSLVGISMEEPFIPEALVLLGPVPTAPYATPSSTENRDAIASLIASHDAIILSHHGTLTVGADLDQAFERLDILEHTAQILVMANQIGQPRPIPEDALGRLMEMRRRFQEVSAREIHPSELDRRIADQVEKILREGGL